MSPLTSPTFSLKAASSSSGLNSLCLKKPRTPPSLASGPWEYFPASSAKSSPFRAFSRMARASLPDGRASSSVASLAE